MAGRFVLNANNGVKYSKGEQRIFALIRKDGKRTTTTALARTYYRRAPHVMNPEKATLATLDSLIKKMAMNREPFTVRKSERRGPHPLTVWIERRR